MTLGADGGLGRPDRWRGCLWRRLLGSLRDQSTEEKSRKVGVGMGLGTQTDEGELSLDYQLLHTTHLNKYEWIYNTTYTIPKYYYVTVRSK